MSLTLAALLLAGGLSGCAGSSEEEYVERPAEDLYAEAQAHLDESDWFEAARAFEEVERQHPYSQWATRAQLMSGYSYYQGQFYDEALVALDNFVELHPGNEDVPYALYLQGMVRYEQISDVARDQGMTEEALQAFRELVSRYPDTDYAKDARLKIDLTLDHLAGKEMSIGRYYQDRGRFVAAINRFRAVVDGYQTTTHVPEALHRLVESYLALGVTDEARDAAAVLGYNFPDSDWYERSYALMQAEGLAPAGADVDTAGAEGGSWLSRAFGG